MLEITPYDIAQLDDKQLRTLVALLCEAELRRRDYSVAAVTWGGHQNARDGGLDVLVSLPIDKPIDGFIPRQSTGFQVKKQDITPGNIAKEMYLGGVLRPAIRELAESRGAYIIVSSKGSTAASALNNRKIAMANATGALADQITLDFYDSTRLASWVRSHAGLVFWVRQAIGRAISGWEPFGTWANPASDTDEEYLSENGVRVCPRLAGSNADLSAEEGLAKIRDILRHPGMIVRLVGLSGVGKTRFVQALFDNRIGNNALNPALAVYTNMNNDPDPQPTGLASDLSANGDRAILIVDNCPADLHARLSAVVRAPWSPLSVLTVEYDIRDDQPEGTESFELQVASTELIGKLLRKRFPSLSPVDARTAADFSGGNARIAIALADTVGRGGALASLNDSQLFERLFLQRQGQDKSLLESAQACALVYSFDSDDLSDNGELARIARLIGATVDQVYRDTAELLRRDLAQRRGKWRAILPHALANRLAITALQNIPYSRIKEGLEIGASERLTISFARRLGYLDNSTEARTIVGDWLDPKGWLGAHVWNFNEFGKAVFENCLPAHPEAGLRAFEVNQPAVDSVTPLNCGDYVPNALRSMAWDPLLFDRCSALLRVLAIHGSEHIAKKAAAMHTSLFHLYLSGTHATVEQRSAVTTKLIASSNLHERGLGFAALDAMLKTTHFTADHNFQFGAHSRDYGYLPRTRDESTAWYRAAFEIAERVALTEGNAASVMKAAIATKFRGLWSKAALREALESASTKLAAKGFWPEGWLAVKNTRYYDVKDKQSENYARLSNLESILRPHNLVQKVRGKVLTSKAEFYDIDELDDDSTDGFRAAIERKNEEVETLGSELAGDRAALAELLPEIVGARGHLWFFGAGLAKGSADTKELWDSMVKQFALLPLHHRSTGAFCGMLYGLRKSGSKLADEFLDDALENEPLAPYFPSLQASVLAGPRDMARLNRSLTLGRAPLLEYDRLNLGRIIEVVPAAEIAAYISALAKMPDGQPVAIRALSMQFLSDRQDKRLHAPELVAVGRELLRHVVFHRNDSSNDHQLCEIIKVCAADGHGYEVARKVCGDLSRAVADHETYAFNHHDLLTLLFDVQPYAALDAFLVGDAKAIDAGKRLVGCTDSMQHTAALDGVPHDVLFSWCAKNPSIRFPLVASTISAFLPAKEGQSATWAPIATELIHRGPDPIGTMRELVQGFRPMMWEGSRAAILTTNASLLGQFDHRGNTQLAAFVEAEKQRLLKEADAERKWETKSDMKRDERFE